MSREADLTAWANLAIAELTGMPPARVELESLSGDASFRRYFRARLPSASYIVVDAPPQTEDNVAFVRIAAALRGAGVTTPLILAVDYQQGFMVQEDFGDTLYLQVLRQHRQDPQQVDWLYRQAIDTLVRLQKNVVTYGFPPYDREMLLREMQLFPDWFCGRFLGLELSSSEQQLIAATQQFLATAALAQPTVVVHRDYHSRNLMIPDPHRYSPELVPALIDFQDAVVGAYSYDLVSLLRDCYISWPLNTVRNLAGYYLQQAGSQGIVTAIDEAAFFRDFDLMGLQRNLKVIGIFARLCIRDGKSQFLADIPQTIRYFTEVAAGYQELDEFLSWFRQRILPLADTRLAAAQS
ncbi:MAG: phosphotransferase [Gammaproteobacteria bacterium]|nr:phosphotransferase [Pseudomonadales bacterium]